MSWKNGPALAREGKGGIATNGSTQRCSPTESASLIDIVQWFKTMTTNEYMKMVKSNNWPSFWGKLWQRSFYDHIIRNENDLAILRDFILNNPLELNIVEESAK